MKRTILAALFCAALLNAQPQISPISGTGWQLCALPYFANWPECAGFGPNSPHGYMVNVLPDAGAAVLGYTITATITATGQQVTLTGFVPVEITPPAAIQHVWTGIFVTFAGAIDWNPSITITEYAVVNKP